VNERVIKAASAVCGRGITEPSPTVKEINTAGIIRQRKTAHRAVIFLADIPYRPLITLIAVPKISARRYYFE
jgi:hypothetical protein